MPQSSKQCDRKVQARRSERRLFVLILGVALLMASIVCAANYGPALVAYHDYSPRNGDMIFQSLPKNRLVNAIEGVSESPFSHCGIVAEEADGHWVVYEAYREVEKTPLRDFVFRGRGYGFAVYRLKTPYQEFIPRTIEVVKSYLGRPYDSQYRMDDTKIYCSELIYKAFLSASGRQLGTPARLGAMNWEPYRDTIKHYERGPVPIDREMVTPRHIAEDQQVDKVFVFNIAEASMQ